MKIPIRVTPNIPFGTVILTSDKLAELVRRYASAISLIGGFDRETAERVIWELLIDDGYVSAIRNIGTLQ